MCKRSIYYTLYLLLVAARRVNAGMLLPADSVARMQGREEDEDTHAEEQQKGCQQLLGFFSTHHLLLLLPWEWTTLKKKEVIRGFSGLSIMHHPLFGKNNSLMYTE